ncbi:MAG: hypothetical protein A2X28_08850 [Elusimicrobia bacterium GWA2_56_46]|nr:MAG: hypothetical protein A2X28_08850 [Elusimicrobia bacterium GWA2_56_46]OGR54415.1 MAG: hypothetical protein A2X39_03930 [Elusimicrobia bacterium GWC2_56_31]HBB67424.1 hypothetical protein [Elusimicrobiota bacterium]HBW22609.1 hypothetical protein [Elusimicrobiota bacterium]
MKNIFAAFIALGFFTQVYGAQADGAPATACVYQYKGEVLLIEPGYETWLPLRSAVTLREGARLKTGPGAWCRILAADGTFINLYENSETLVERLRLEKDNRDYGFNFIKGRILWMAARLKHKASKFEVRTPSAVCAVRGTDFTIDLASAAAEIGLFEGQLDVKSGGKETVLAAGSEAVVSGPGAEAAVSAHFSGLMQAEQRRYLKLKKRAEDLRRKLETRENFIDDFVRIQQQKLQDFDNRRREKLNKRK